MGKYDDAAAKAAQQADEELKEATSEILNVDLSLFPEAADKKAVEDLIAKVQKSTNRNEMVTAVQVAGAALTKEGLKAFNEAFKVAKKVLI